MTGGEGVYGGLDVSSQGSAANGYMVLGEATARLVCGCAGVCVGSLLQLATATSHLGRTVTVAIRGYVCVWG